MSDIPETSTDASFVPSPDDALTMATNLARNCGWSVFPCSVTKAPAIPGPGGYKHATKDPDEIKALWQICSEIGFPYGPLVKLLLLTGQRLREVGDFMATSISLGAGMWPP